MKEKDLHLMTHLEPVDQRIDDVRTYFKGDPGRRYTGRLFEQIGQVDGVVTNPNRFDADDMVAVTALSVEIPPESAAELIRDDGGEFSALLAGIPTAPIWEVKQADLAPETSDASLLWRRLRKLDGLGRVTTSKLMAHKRPHTIPVFDRVIEGVLGVTTVDWWDRLQFSLTEDVRSRLIEIRVAAGVPDAVSLLRILDVALWMPNHSRFRGIR